MVQVAIGRVEEKLVFEQLTPTFHASGLVVGLQHVDGDKNTNL